MMYPPQDAYPPQQPSGAAPYFPQDAYPPQQAFGAASYSPQGPYPPQQPSVPYFPQASYPPQQPSGMAYSPQGAYPPQQAFEAVPYSPQDPFMVPQPYEAPRNLRAKRAIINGFVSLILSVFTPVTLAGFAGLITGTLAIVYGFMGLSTAKQLPGDMGRRQAIIGIVLGFVAWFVVILSLIVRAATPSV